MSTFVREAITDPLLAGGEMRCSLLFKAVIKYTGYFYYISLSKTNLYWG